MTQFEDQTMLEIALSKLPLPITFASIDVDPNLVIAGDDWSASFLCDWLLDGPDTYLDRYNENDVVTPENEILTSQDVQFLLGHEIIGITATEDMINPTFHLTGGINLIVHAETDIDPWVLSVPGITLVGWVGRDEHGVPLPKPQAGRDID